MTVYIDNVVLTQLSDYMMILLHQILNDVSVAMKIKPIGFEMHMF